ncbi:hypothetical protein BDF19DRAFT_290159 [Syncephalis fuscata]|nr:hypothetical protein BDF19DRAFT_290159 [Syncephalis fuscata]
MFSRSTSFLNIFSPSSTRKLQGRPASSSFPPVSASLAHKNDNTSNQCFDQASSKAVYPQMVAGRFEVKDSAAAALTLAVSSAAKDTATAAESNQVSKQAQQPVTTITLAPAVRRARSDLENDAEPSAKRYAIESKSGVYANISTVTSLIASLRHPNQN